LKLLN